MLNTYLQWDRTRLPSAFVFHLRAVLHICVAKGWMCLRKQRSKPVPDSCWSWLYMIYWSALTNQQVPKTAKLLLVGAPDNLFVLKTGPIIWRIVSLHWHGYITVPIMASRKRGIIINIKVYTDGCNIKLIEWSSPHFQLLVLLYYNHIIIIFSGESACWVALL